MSDQKRQAKRASRAERRAAEEAAALAAAEKAAKERKQQTIIGLVVVAIIVVLVGIAGFAVYKATHPATSDDATSSTITVDEAYETLQNVSVAPSRADEQAGFLVSSNGYDDPVEDAPTFSIYMEPLCPGCASIHQQLDETLVSLMNAGQLNLDLHFMTFQDSKSTDEYSTRAFNGAIYIAENDDDPNHLLGYLENIYNADFQPGELDNYESVSNEQLKEQAINAGVSEDVADAAFSGANEYQEWLKAADAYTIRRPELFNSDDAFTSPTLAINGTYWDFSSEMKLTDEDLTTVFLTAIGLDESKVGVQGEMPSIGSDGTAISASTGE